MSSAADVLKNLKAARSKPAGFGFGQASSPAGCILLVEPNKNGDALAAMARKAPGVKSSCGGTALWDGAGAVFHCDKPLGGFEKAVEGWFRANKLSVKITLEKSQAEAGGKGGEKADEDDEPGNLLFARDTVEKRARQSKSKEMHFAFGLSKKGNLLALHPLRTGKTLFRMIKAENGASRPCWGKVGLEGALLTFTCEEKPIPGLKRHLRMLFQEWKLPYRVMALGPDGEEADDEAEEAGDIGAEGPGARAVEPDGLRKRLDALRAELKPIVAQNNEYSDDIREAYAAANAALVVGDLATSGAGLARLERLAADAKTSQGGTIIDRWKRIRPSWDLAVEGVDAQIGALQSALRKSGDQELGQVAEFGLNAISGNFRVRLTAAFMELDRAGDPVAFGKAAAAGVRLIRDFAKHLDSDPRIRVVDENPFQVRVSVKTTYIAALKKMERVLSAAG